MARIFSSHRRLIFISVLLLLIVPSASADRKVGGRSEVKDVLSNEEVQELGRFSIEYYNIRLRRTGVEPPLSFHRVVAAERQVVSGIKYYLHVVAWQGRTGPRRTFYAVVLVKPWLKTKDLISFIPTSGISGCL